MFALPLSLAGSPPRRIRILGKYYIFPYLIEMRTLRPWLRFGVPLPLLSLFDFITI